MLKQASKLLLPILFLFLLSTAVSADTIPVNAYLFYGDGCPHCANERQFLSVDLKSKYSNLSIYEFEVYYNRNNVLLFQKVAEQLKIDANGVPFIVIGDKPFIGFSDGITSREIDQRVSGCSTKNCPDSVASIVGISTLAAEDSANNEPGNQDAAKMVDLPIVGEIDVLQYSLPLLTVFMGILDGFNPCALWTLLFLISLLLGMRDRKRMWILGSTFIIASASVYFLFMSAWLNLILFLGFVIWIRTMIGVLALIGGGYSVREYFVNKNSGCKVTGTEKRQRVFDKLKTVVQNNNLWLSLGGIVALAFAVNLVELICSAGLPAVYTQILALNQMPDWQYYSYIIAYVFFFMIDDLFVFFAAMITFEMTGITTKYARVSRLVGGIVMATIGLILIFKPEWLMSG